MAEAKIGSITLLDQENIWSIACKSAFDNAGVDMEVCEPSADLLTPDRVRSNIFIVPIPSHQRGRLEFVRRIEELEGLALVVAEKSLKTVERECARYQRAIFLGKKNGNFLNLINITIMFSMAEQRRPLL